MIRARKFVRGNSLSSRNSHKALYTIYKSICNKQLALNEKVETVVLDRVIKRQLFDILYHAYGISPDIVKLIIKKHPDLATKR